MKWTLKRTMQCAKCPWRVDVDPYDIPNGYSARKHQALSRTIARPGDLRGVFGHEPEHVMACHETHDAHCVGWLVNQLTVGNNIGLRIRMLSCENAQQIHVVGAQHQRFEETLPT